ncbi:MAG: Threonylcarbamoyl-AMP synthase [Alphaproteobacteria bacterium MarineAlpha5_Bin7]|nr:MAG: Threonylcarbamoyl-AMP synthase [Alphaproteobacteria bacterium MarineAlpha5_Bin7]|tara:strand:- start:1291 stop:2220 length:930 start_codon:yes stop_codon:yes gene_type:complete
MKINLDKAINILKNGELIIFPTETVYGLGGDATNKKTIKKIYKLKKRPIINPIICHFKNINQIEKNFLITPRAYDLANKFWPGPLTLILEKKDSSHINSILSNNNKFVGCRIPNNQIALNLLNEIDFPIAAPSANISSKLSSTRISHISDILLKNAYFVDGGESLYGLESTVVKVIDDKNAQILRLGSITLEQIKKIIPNTKIDNVKNSLVSPGQLTKHYSPNKNIRINVDYVKEDESLLNFGSNDLKSKILELNLSHDSNLEEASKNFYNFLHILDKSNCKGIAIANIPNEGLGKTLNDRLMRAASIE